MRLLCKFLLAQLSKKVLQVLCRQMRLRSSCSMYPSHIPFSLYLFLSLPPFSLYLFLSLPPSPSLFLSLSFSFSLSCLLSLSIMIFRVNGHITKNETDLCKWSIVVFCFSFSHFKTLRGTLVRGCP